MSTPLTVLTVCGILTVILVVWHVISKRRAGALLAASELALSELRSDATTMASELGGGDFKRLVSLRGTIQCDEPLISPMGERSCAYYKTEIERKYRTSNSDGKKQTRTETMSEQSEGRDFFLAVDDQTIKVHIDGADHEALVETVDRFEPATGDMQIGFGGFSMNLPASHGNDRTIGYRYQEHILSTDGQLTIVGEVSDVNGQLSIGRGGLIFLFSRLTRNELIKKASNTARLTAIGSAMSLVGTVIGAVLHLLA